MKNLTITKLKKHIKENNGIELFKDLEKKFTSSNGKITITRNIYETFPDPMAACLFNDEEMQELAENIQKYYEEDLYGGDKSCWDELERLKEDSDDLEYWDELLQPIETTAVDMGMLYYEDIPEKLFYEYIKFTE